MRRPVIAYRCLPMRSPLQLTLVSVLALDYWHAHILVWWVVVFLLAVFWALFALDSIVREELDVFRNR